MYFAVNTVLWKHSISLLLPKINCKDVHCSPRASTVTLAIQMHGDEWNLTPANPVISYLHGWKWNLNAALNHSFYKEKDLK